MSSRLPVRTREIVLHDGTRSRALGVFCPAQDRTVDPRCCAACPRLTAMWAKAVECRPRAENPASVGVHAPPALTCVREDVPVSLLPVLAGAEPWFFPVVDAGQRFLGFVWSGQLLQRRLPIRLLVAGDLLVSQSLALSESEPVGRAVRWMGHRGARAVALLDAGATPTGTLTDVQALRALVASRAPRAGV